MAPDLRIAVGEVLSAARMTVAQRLTGVTLWSFTDRTTGVAVVSRSTLSRCTGTSERDVQRHLRALESAGVVSTEARAGLRSRHVWISLGFPQGGCPTPQGGGATHPGCPTPPLGGCDTPQGGGATHPNSVISHKNASSSSTRRDLPPEIEILRAKLAAHGLTAIWDRLDDTQLAEITALVALHGDDPLIRAAANARAAHGTPAVYAQAWLAGWRSIPAPGQRLAVVRRRCPIHDTDQPCAGCRADQLAGTAPTTEGAQ